MKEEPERNRRILVVDDNPTIHDDFRRILAAAPAPEGLDAEAARLFGPAAAAGAPALAFLVDAALQGQDALRLVTEACAAGQPYALAFVDMRMPPGWDGLTTIGKLWEVDPELQVVICTAYSDHSWDEIQAQLSARERWLVLKKPFDKIEAVQLANALTEKWNLGRQAHRQVAALLAPTHGLIGQLEALAGTAPSAVQAGHLAGAQACAGDLLRRLQEILGGPPPRAEG